MANPVIPIQSDHLYNDDDMINHAMNELYAPHANGMAQRVPTNDEMIAVFHEFLEPFLDPDPHAGENEEFDHYDLQGLITNIVLFDASLDHSVGLIENLPANYDPYVLLDLIGNARGFMARNESSELLSVRIQESDDAMPTHIFHWASERLFPYFVDQLGRGFVLDSQTGNGDSYLHSYLKSCTFRIMNPSFVKDLLDLGFDLREQNADGYTSLHIIVYEGLMVHEGEAPFAHLSNQERKTRSQKAKRYNRFYQTLQLLFAHPSANIDIPDDDGITVRNMMEEEPLVEIQPAQYLPNNVREAYNISQGRPRAIERARQQAAVEQIPSIPGNVGKIISKMMGTNLTRARNAVKKEKNHMGGRYRTHRQQKNHKHRMTRGKKQKKQKRHTRRV